MLPSGASANFWQLAFFLLEVETNMWAQPQALPVMRAADVQTVLASTATAAGALNVNSTAITLARPMNGIEFELDVTVAATAANDTLDVKIQTLIDGTNWLDVVYFTQVLGNGGAVRIIAKILTNTAQAMYAVSTALTSGNIRHVFGNQWRLNYVQANGTAAGFTFSVTCKVE